MKAIMKRRMDKVRVAGEVWVQNVPSQIDDLRPNIIIAIIYLTRHVYRTIYIVHNDCTYYSAGYCTNCVLQ
jgi:hypothetical protein